MYRCTIYVSCSSAEIWDIEIDIFEILRIINDTAGSKFDSGQGHDVM